MTRPKIRVPVVDLPAIDGLVGIISAIAYYYEGSGNNKRLKKKVFYNGDDILFAISYYYDAQNDVIKKVRSNA